MSLTSDSPPTPPESIATTALSDLVKQGISDGTGEFIHDLGTSDAPLSGADFDAQLSSLRAAALGHDCDVTVLRKSSVGKEGSGLFSGEVLVRRRGVSLLECTPERRSFTEVRVCVVGNVDSGKSTMLGVLTHGVLDDGRGSARLSVFRHQHEASTGRTSSISHGSLGFNSACDIVTYGSIDKFSSSSSSSSLAGGAFSANDQKVTSGEAEGNSGEQKISAREQRFTSKSPKDSAVAKLVTFVDLAGHERYLKTTMFGMTGHQPDYAMLMVGANMGVIGMTKEHLGVAAALRLPFFLVVTKTDICPAPVFKTTLDQIKKVVRSLGGKKVPLMVKSEADMLLCARTFARGSIVPVFCTSSVTGLRIDLLRAFLNLLPATQRWDERRGDPVELIVDTDWSVRGAGTVLSGTLTRGILTLGGPAPLLLGPDPRGNFAPVGVKSLFVNGAPAACAYPGQSCSVALRKVARRDVRAGMRLVSVPPGGEHPAACLEFDAEVLVLYHSTTIAKGYEAVVHCGNVKQTARLVGIEGEKAVLRTGDKARVRFRFMRYPECVVKGSRIVFREGKAKGIGKVVDVIKYVPASEKEKEKAQDDKGRGRGKKPRVRNRGRSSSADAAVES